MTTQPWREGYPATKGGRCPALSLVTFNPKLLYVDELEFVFYLLFIELYLFLTSVGLVFSQGVPHVADEKDLSAPLATEPQAPSR